MTEQSSGGNAPLTEEAAASLIASSLIEEENPEQHQPEAEAPRGETEQTVEAEGAEPETPEANSEPEEPQYYDFEKFDPEMPVRLRDGSTVRFGDIKRSWAELQELPKHRQELESRAAQIQADMQKAAQQAQFFQQANALAMQVAQEYLPQPPQPPARTGDVVQDFENWTAFQEQKAAYDARVQRIGQLQQAQHHHAVTAQREQQERQKAIIAEQQAKLREVIRDEAQLAELGRDILKYGHEAYGFTPQELNEVNDHRIVLMARDAIAWRKLQAEKPKVMEKAKAAPAPAVQQPGKRVSEAERVNQAYQEDRARLRKSGRADDAVALIAKHLL